MAQGDFWEFGVAYPLKNHKLRHPSRISALTLIATAGQTQFTTGINNSYYSIVPYVQKDDYLILGTTTQEILQVSSIENVGGLARVNTKTALQNSHTAGSNIVLYGSKMAGGWVIDPGTVRINPLGHIPFEGGASDNYAQAFSQSVDEDGNPNQNGLEVVRQELDSNLLIAQTAYRFGCMYRADIDSDTNAKVQVHFNDSTQTFKRSILTGNQSDVLTWTRHTNPFWCTTKDGGQTIELDLAIEALTGSRAFFMVDDLFFEHARGIGTPVARIRNVQAIGGGSTYSIALYESSISGWTVGSNVFVSAPDGTYAVAQVQFATSVSLIVAFLNLGSTSAITKNAKIEQINDGYYQLQDWPIQSSLSYDRIESMSVIPTEHGSGVLFNQSGIGDKSERWVLSASFTAVSQTIYNQLKKFIWYQDQGNLINIHTFNDDLPSVMTGRLRIKNFTKVGTPLFTTVDFTIEFEEVLI